MFVKAQGPKFRKARKLLKWEDGTFLDAIAFMATELSVSFDEVAMKVARYGPAPSELAAEGGVVKGFSSVNPQVGVFFCVLLALQYAAQPFLIKSFIPENVNKVSLVFACECVKIVIALVIMIGEGSLKANFKNWTPKVGLLSVVPAVVYAGQNFLLQTAYGSMDSVTFNCLNQTKLVSTALCVYLFFGVRQSFTQVVALGGLLLAGVMLSMDETGVETGVGVAAVLTASATSGVASAATQYSLQAHRRSSNAMTIEMALAAIPFLISSAGITSVADFDVLFANWTRATWVPVITSAFGGIFVGQVTKHLGGVAKGFAIVGGLVLTGIVQSAAVGALEVQHLVGLVLVAWSTYAHAANPPKPIDRVPPPRPGGAVSPVSSPQKMKSV
ncbi:Drug/Metabolite transporter superfamily [Micromonas pusilla CCMP1545]|uniref:Drug/Metabolite transporter superfamily n=1 Tax=Micromonas pusilla (strain CCMP1545) TaxID=564608 RepID=C1MMI4_MICPC|nr:Drug/Metabolite transporter superfamily [Micromonas pusilla CCMP1545]EEH59057.1 Drug/Metabolite transporter superfamily [Micromonas pusilla CCMP1545]|eukprot:XP_003057412.1 Drug/Metabolite transporter superfamily [Micromonas pusilla CCMP1545]